MLLEKPGKDVNFGSIRFRNTRKTMSGWKKIIRRLEAIAKAANQRKRGFEMATSQITQIK